MGTVTAIGAADGPRYNATTSGTATNVTYGGSLTTVYGTRASIAFDSWEVAVGAAMVAARSSRGVRVNKVGGEWVVSWDAPVAINPQPYYPANPRPSWQYPYGYTTTVTNGTLTNRTIGEASA